MTLEAAAAKFTTHNFGRGEIKGSGKAPLHGAEVTIPYKPFGTKGPSEVRRRRQAQAEEPGREEQRQGCSQHVHRSKRERGGE